MKTAKTGVVSKRVPKKAVVAAAKKPRRKTEPSAAESIRNAAMKAAQYALEKKATDIHVLDLRRSLR